MLHFGLTGNPISHSLSPRLHTAAYQALGLDWEYSLYPAHSVQEFGHLVSEMLSGQSALAGLNITTPYKPNAFAAAARPDRCARLTGSVNVLTLDRDDGGEPTLYGCNTDGLGLVRSLQNDAGLQLAGSKAVVCGTGAVATTAILALLDAKVDVLSVLSRDGSKAQKFINDLLNLLPADYFLDRPGVQTRAASYGDEQANHLVKQADLVIDATTLGMQLGDPAPIDTELLHDGQVAYDLVYGHGITAFVAGAQANGAQAFDGLGMLVEQAALTIEIWAAAQGLDITAPRDVMRSAIA